MPELLLELFSEEIPARMQQRAADDLLRLVTTGLKDAELDIGAAEAFAGPRRLALVVQDVPLRTPDVVEERRGPRVDAPEKAIQGFLRATGLALEDCDIVDDPKKGPYYVARMEKKGRSTQEVLKELIPEAVRKFPWPKAMRWGSRRLKWVRPLHSILCLLGGSVVAFDIEGIKSGNTTRGHRFLAPEPFTVQDFADYEEKLRSRYVILRAGERASIIHARARALAKEAGLELVEDEALVRETAGLTEWPVVLMGQFDESFLEVPEEVIITAIRVHQKCFALRHAEKDGGKLANRYLLVANIEAPDDGVAITQGNDRVIAARLSDARFFWQQDLATPLPDRVQELDGITFHAKLGTQGDRVRRMMALARDLAPFVDADEEEVALAARLAKADLVTEMVGEFPELQGIMGCYYARKSCVPEHIARAIAEHYKPRGADDDVPIHPVSVAVALADRIDMLAGFWAANEKPTGSRDPFALRRAALGLIRIILGNQIQLPLAAFIEQQVRVSPAFRPDDGAGEKAQEPEQGEPREKAQEKLREKAPEKSQERAQAITQDLLAFIRERLKVFLREDGHRHDHVDAVYAAGEPDDLLLILLRLQALENFLQSEDGANLLAGIKRALNILKIEEKKDKRTFSGPPNQHMLIAREEKELASAITRARGQVGKAIKQEDYEAALAAMARLRGPVDAFFDKVTVNAEDPTLRENRLKLLNGIREVVRLIADFGRIEG